MSLGWVKSHIGVIHRNERADEIAKKGPEKRVDVLQVTEGGIRQKIKRWRKEARQVEGFGKGKVMATNYSGQIKGPFKRGASRSEKQKVLSADIARGKATETRNHLVFSCEKWEE